MDIYKPTLTEAIEAKVIPDYIVTFLPGIVDKEDLITINKYDFILTGSYAGAALLSQLFRFQAIPDKNGHLRAIMRLGKLWSAYSYADWAEQICENERSIAKAVTNLVNMKIVEKRQMIFMNKNILHISLNLKEYTQQLTSVTMKYWKDNDLL